MKYLRTIAFKNLWGLGRWLSSSGVSSQHPLTWQITTIGASRYRRSNSPFWPLWVLQANGAHTGKQVHIHKHIKVIFQKDTLEEKLLIFQSIKSTHSANIFEYLQCVLPVTKKLNFKFQGLNIYEGNNWVTKCSFTRVLLSY